MRTICPCGTVPRTGPLYFCLLHYPRRFQAESDVPQKAVVLFNGALPQGDFQCADAQVGVWCKVQENAEDYIYRAWVQRVGTADAAQPMEFTLKKEVLYTYQEPLDDAEESWQFLISENAICESNILNN